MSFRFGIDPFAWAWDSFLWWYFLSDGFLGEVGLKGGGGGIFFCMSYKAKTA